MNSIHALKNAVSPSWNIAANVEAGVQRPAGILEALRQLVTGDVPLHFDHVHMPSIVERHNIGAELAAEGRLACDWEERGTDERVRVGPQQLLDFLLIEVRSSLHPSERDQFVFSNLE
ncbi:MAG: hypothetical protein F4Y40_02325 [Acidimicrobiia bacterium]|nr:hypothetical protein [Acidimicrobiia bacterium]